MGDYKCEKQNVRGRDGGVGDRETAAETQRDSWEEQRDGKRWRKAKIQRPQTGAKGDVTGRQ